MKVNGSDISKYGVVQADLAVGSVAGLVEKPNFEQANLNLALIDRDMLMRGICEILCGQAPSAGGKVQLTDAIKPQAAKDQVKAVTLNGQRFDCGYFKVFFKAIIQVVQRYGLL